ncbi:MAG: helix-turn-helix transcriptional regulator [Pseudomonadota bacterium]
MAIPPDATLMSKLRMDGAEVHSLQVSSDRSVLVFDASYPARESEMRNVPALFAMMCVSGGGDIEIRTATHEFLGTIEPGDIGIAAPNAPGRMSGPEMRIIGLGIEIRALTSSFGETWPNYLRPEFLSRPLRDPMVEATMMQIGYTHAGRISDSVLLHAAHMIVHQLLKNTVEPIDDAAKGAVHPLPTGTLEEIRSYILAHVEETVLVDDLAKHVGISRYHFSRRFRAAAGQSPYQFILDLKLDHAAMSLSADRRTKIIDVANMVGFRNPASFSEAFRRRFGETPRRWRLGRR